jgi:hypothetical protein
MKSISWVAGAAVLMACVLVMPGSAQTTREVLTNDKVIDMVRAGLGDDVIVEKIRQSECQCDTSADGLTKLKAANVSNEVILALVSSAGGQKPYSDSDENRPAPPPVSAAPVGKTAAGLDILSQMPEPGIYLTEEGKITTLDPTIYSGTRVGVFGMIVTYGLKKTKIRGVIRGNSARMQVKTRRPSFYFLFGPDYDAAGAAMSGFAGYSASSPAEFMLVSMKVKSKTREATLGVISMFSNSTGAPDKEVREFDYEKIATGLYRVTPKADLAPGEYCFYYAGNSGTDSKVFDFGVGH